MDSEKILNANDIAIKTFMKKKVDYALLLNGEWGVGKTYYCKKHLKELLNDDSDCKKENKKEKIHVICISLFGKTSIEEITREYGFKLLKISSKKEADSKTFDGIISFIDSFKVKDWISPLISIGFKSVRNNVGKIGQTIKHVNIESQVLLIFDDLERCNSDVLVDLLGQINSEFIEKGYHVLFVANESVLRNNNDYFNKKERIVRTTIRFQQNLQDFIKNIVSSDSLKSSPISSLFNKNEEQFNSFVLRFSRITNLRTWQFTFDNFNTVISKSELSIDNPFLYQLLCIILLDTYYYCKVGFIRESKSGPYVDYNKENEEVIQNDNKEEELFKRDFNVDFLPVFYGRESIIQSNKRLSNYRYIFFESIRRLVSSACFDVSLFMEEFQKYYPNANEYEEAYWAFSSYHLLSEEELQDAIIKVVTGVVTNKFNFYQLVNISDIFSILEEDGYLPLFEQFDYKKIILENFKDIQLQKKDVDWCEHSLANHCEFIRSVLKEKLDKISCFDEEAERFLEHYKTLDEKNYEELDYILKERLFERLDKNHLIDSWMLLSCKKITNIDIYITSGHGVFSESEFPYFEKAVKKINEEVKEFEKTGRFSKQAIELKQLLRDINYILNQKRNPKEE